MDDLQSVEIVIQRACHFKKKEGKKRGCQRCGLAKGHVAHIGAPPSLNVFGGGPTRVYLGMKQTWQRLLTTKLEESGLPRGLQRVVVEGEVTFPDRGRRDQGNFRVLLEKALGDALVRGYEDMEGGWLADDDWLSYEFGGLAYNYEHGVSRTRLLLFPSNVPLASTAPALALPV